MKPQARKVLRHLEAAGAQGVHSRQLRADFVADPPTRVCELIRLGYNISREKQGNGSRYTLRPAHTEAAGVERPETIPPEGDSSDPGLASQGGGALAPTLANTSAPPEPSNRGGGSHSPAPAAPLPGSVVLGRKRTSKGHEYAHQPPDSRRDWVLVLDYSDKASPDFRWERRAPSQAEAAA